MNSEILPGNPPFRGEAIILAGGLGTRLRPAVADIPKCLAPVAGYPFLTHVIRHLLSNGVEKFIFSLGHGHKQIERFLDQQFPTLNYQCTVETEPLGTGGAIQLASKRASEKNVIVVNGDTIFKADIKKAFRFHSEADAECTVMLKRMNDFDRYGAVELDTDGRIVNFREKQFFQTADINAGIYILNVEKFRNATLPEKFSFEKDYLEKYYSQKNIFGIADDAYFIDIGIPADFRRAGEELKQLPLLVKEIDRHWTIFLDRDGVINYEKENDYITTWDEFEFYPGVAEAIRLLADKVNLLIVVSNQRGVGRGLMTEDALLGIQQKMKATIEKEGGRIDKIYYCTSPDEKNFYRKPNPGMALLALEDFPAISPGKAIMVGNKMSDMQFGRNAGMHTVYLKTTHPLQPVPHPDVDLSYNILSDFAKAL